VGRRIRTVKPEWLEDELLALASSDARVLSIALILLADDHGRGRANTVMLSGQIFPGKPVELLVSAIAELVSMRFVFTYDVEGQKYYAIRNWLKHQRIDRASASKFPEPPEEISALLGEPSIPNVLAKDRVSRDPGPGPFPDPDPKIRMVTLPGDLEPLPRQVEKCKKLGLKLEREFTKFKNHHASKGSKFVDWHRAFDTWIGNAEEFMLRDGKKPQADSEFIEIK
jgi:hypothetical protein